MTVSIRWHLRASNWSMHLCLGSEGCIVSGAPRHSLSPQIIQRKNSLHFSVFDASRFIVSRRLKLVPCDKSCVVLVLIVPQIIQHKNSSHFSVSEDPWVSVSSRLRLEPGPCLAWFGFWPSLPPRLFKQKNPVRYSISDDPSVFMIALFPRPRNLDYGRTLLELVIFTIRIPRIPLSLGLRCVWRREAAAFGFISDEAPRRLL
ncbi:hypothetical protein C8R47DRAFT_1072893 [Mycena vitilis]|nr:hypothetical protein C8R47DRAFT_1072893 [Mycena vitilis]